MVAAFVLPETQFGVLHFTITNHRPNDPLTVGGYAPTKLYLLGDPTDGFVTNVLGPATPYVIAPGGVAVVPVEIIPDLEADDPGDVLGGLWSLALDPHLLLMDEPTSALDPARRNALGETLTTLTAQGRGLLIATHDVDFAHDFANRVIVLADGVMVEQGPAQDVLANPTHPATKALLES